jgi:hypothetical protein
MPRSLRKYFFICLAAVGIYAYAGLTGTRLLGDDVESSDGPPTSGSRLSGGHGGRYSSRGYFHK